jgi:hypothetical protein
LRKTCKSQILLARQQFSMVLLWRQLHRNFLRFNNWTRPSGRRGNFYRLARGQQQLYNALSTAESLSCPKSIGSKGGSTTIFQGQQYSSCSKAGGCRAAQLLGGFRRNLLIVSWVTQTPRCQTRILRPFGRSGQELPAEYQVVFILLIFRCLQVKKSL